MGRVALQSDRLRVCANNIDTISTRKNIDMRRQMSPRSLWRATLPNYFSGNRLRMICHRREVCSEIHVFNGCGGVEAKR